MNYSSDFSVLLAVYKNDDPSLFKKAISTIFSNTLLPHELIVVGDGELTSDQLEIISDFSEKFPVMFLQLPSNVGLAKALNEGLKKIKTKYTIRADADDFNYPNRFEILVDQLSRGYDVVGSAMREVDKNGREVAFRYCPLNQLEIRSFARKRNPFNHMTVGYRTDVILSVGGYPPLYLKEDYALWAKLLAIECKVCNLNMVLVDATAGLEMFKRRGGVRYAWAEINLQRHLVKCRLKSPVNALVDGVLRSSIFLAPNSLRQFFYLNFLRARNVEK